MPNLIATMMSLGDPKLQEIVGRSCFRIISAIDDRYIGSRQLSNLIVNRYGDNILFIKSLREEILDVLLKEEAEQLALMLDGAVDDDPYRQIKNKNYSLGSENLKIIYNYFSLEPPLIEEKIVSEPSIKSVDVRKQKKSQKLTTF